jgi:hypothetical protein
MSMSRDEFANLMTKALNSARANAERSLGSALPKHEVAAVYGLGNDGKRMSIEAAEQLLYFSDSLSYAIIDVAVLEVWRDSVVYWLRPSGHPPVPWMQTWGGPDGPFKQLVAAPIKVSTDDLPNGSSNRGVIA